MKFPVIAFVVTIAAGFAADSIFYTWNWPNAGIIFAIAAMEALFLWSNRKPNEREGG